MHTRMLARLLFFVARSRPVGILVRSCFAHWSFLLPLKRLQETPECIAFAHPKPAYEHHLLIVPKKSIPNLLALGKELHYAMALLATAQNIVANLNWRPGSYVFCANGGSRQDIPQVHFHLYAGTPPLFSMEGASGAPVQVDERVHVLCHTQEEHLQLRLTAHGCSEDGPALAQTRMTTEELFVALVQTLVPLDRPYQLMRQGYTFALTDVRPQTPANLTAFVLTRTLPERSEPGLGEPAPAVMKADRGEERQSCSE